jgi:hypothetical protein
MKTAKLNSELSVCQMELLAAMYNDIINICEKYRHIYYLQSVVNVEKLEAQSEKLSKAAEKQGNLKNH